MRADWSSPTNAPLSFRMLVVGVGGLGCVVLNRFSLHTGALPDYIAIHTDVQALSASSAPRQIQMGAGMLQGASTGGDVRLAVAAAEQSEDELRRLFSDYQLIIFIVGLGGGTGSGATPFMVRIARDAGIFVLVLATLPFVFEGDSRRLVADTAIRELRLTADAVLPFPNERLSEHLGPEANIRDLFALSDEHLTSGIFALWHLLGRKGLINLSFRDLREFVRRGRGPLAMACVETSAEESPKFQAASILSSPLMERGTLPANAQAIMLGLIGGPELSLAAVQALVAEVRDIARPDVHLHVGVSISTEHSGRLILFMVAASSWSSDGEDEAEASTNAHKRQPTTTVGAMVQPELLEGGLVVETQGRGKFKGVDPTLHGGTDLDIPTFIRRNIKLPGLRNP